MSKEEMVSFTMHMPREMREFIKQEASKNVDTQDSAVYIRGLLRREMAKHNQS
jgi:hypothetical protein